MEKKNNLDPQYNNLLKDILEKGIKKQTRNGEVLSVFGRQIRHSMSDGFPLLTGKKIFFKGIVTELLWFLTGQTNISFLLKHNNHIWDGDAYKGYKAQCVTHSVDPMSKEQFISAIKLGNNNQPHFIPDLTGYKLGDLGPIYGKQWRNWGYADEDFFINVDNSSDEGLKGHGIFYKKHGIDQISNLISELKTNPDSRRLMVNAWNVGELDQMVLPPCHYGFQVYTRELSLDERLKLWDTKFGFANEEQKNQFNHDVHLDTHGIPKRAISLMWNQRSVDTFLGLPFNIASYGLLLEIIAKEVNMVPDELIGNLGDVHLYSNHIEQAKEQIGRVYTSDERSEMLKEAMGYENYHNVIKELMPFGGGLSEYYETYKIPHHTREPYPLPKVEITERNWYQHQLVKEHLGPKTFSEKILSYRPDCFELIGYQSHPKIKAPLSN
jgi:thymidylate synthase